jgi:xylulokinase
LEYEPERDWAIMPARIVISMDSSTTACKAIAWDAHGRALAEGRAAYPCHAPHPGWNEQDAEDWWAGACRALRDCLAQVDARRLDALAITHQRESFAPVDAAGVPIRRAILWNDERSRQQVAALERRFGRDALHRLTGKPPSMTASISKLLWLVEHEPQVAARAAHFLDVHAFLVARLTGERRTSLASADPLGVLDMGRRAWASDLIAELGLRPDQFVELVEPGAPIGHITPAAAAATGLPAGLPVIAGAGDGQCAGLGADVAAPGRAYLNLGTGIASGACSDVYLCDRAFRTLIAPLPGAYYVEHILRGGVYTVAWFVEQFAADLRAAGAAGPGGADGLGGAGAPGGQAGRGRSAEELLEEAAAAVAPGSEGLLLVPYWNNVMNPYWDPLASGITVGWRGVHGRGHFYRAILEGIAFEQRLVGDAMMAASGQRFATYTAMGGGSRSPLWLQIMADVTGVPVVRSTTSEATCLGAGILAATGAGWYADAAAAAAAMTGGAARYDPAPEAQKIYDPLYHVYQTLFPALQAALDRLAVLTHGLAPQGGETT